jgi:hypothetical protein
VSNNEDREKNPLPFTSIVPFKIRTRIYDFRDKVDTTRLFVDWDWLRLIEFAMDIYRMGVIEGMTQRTLFERYDKQ